MKRLNGSNQIFVVETNGGRVYLGRIKVTSKTVTVYTGLVGRPPILDITEIDSTMPASLHPDVVVSK